MQTTYNGNDIFKPYNFGLYGMDAYSSDSSLDWQESKENIKSNFVTLYGDKIEKHLKAFGLTPTKYEYWSPKFYNFATDSLDLTVTVTDQALYETKTSDPNFKATVQKLLDANKPYPGYMPLTAETAEKSINDMDACTMQAILQPVFKDITEEEARADIYEWIVCNYACDHCELIHADADYYNEEDQATIKKCEATN